MPAQTCLFDGLAVDNFAGGGGAATGIELALGRPVDIAINHDPDAIEMHKKNHPFTKHYCESVWDIKPRQVTQGRPVSLAWFSPDCKHFSKAKGGKPVDKNIRGLAWVAVRWAATVRPTVIILENVEEFKTWGPVKDGQPIKKQKGRTFKSFVNALKNLGYLVDSRELKACDYGAPTIRKRLFLIARCDGKPIVWPDPTHGDPKSEAVQNGILKPWRTAAEVIDFSLPCPSIFNRKKPLAEATLKRIAKGIRKFVIDNPDPFILSICQNGFGGDNRTNSINEPLRTIVTKAEHCLVTPYMVSCNHTASYYNAMRGQTLHEPLQTITQAPGFAVVTPTLIQMGYGEKEGQQPRTLNLDKPLGTVVSGGNKFALVSAFIHKYYDGGYKSCGSHAADPLGTVTAVDHNALVTAHLEIFRNGASGGNMKEPLNTIMTSPGHFAQIQAFLVKYYGQGFGQDLQDPMHTVTQRDRFGLVIIQGQQYQIADIGLRMLQPHELYAAQGFPQDYIIDIGASGKKLSKSAQVARCGNSVPPVFAEALVRANLPEMCGRKINTMADLHSEIAV